MDDGLSGDVDFDFFEDGNKQSPSRSNSKSPLNTTVNGKPPIPSSSKSPASAKASDDKYGDDKSPVDYSSNDSSSRHSYSSDYDSDDDKDKDSPKRAVTSINARLPSADSGGRRNAPRAGNRRKSRSDTDSDISKSDSEDSDRDSSSAYSDGRDDDDKKYQSSSSKQNKDSGKVRAWEAESETKTHPQNVTTDSSHRQTSESRPKSSYKRNASRKVNANSRRRSSRSVSDSDSDSYTSDSDSDSDSSQKSNSDSEITDVSPLQSADSSPVLKRRSHKHVSVISAPRKEHKPFKELPDTSENTGHRPAEGTMEFKLLMQAVAELDSEKQKRIKASSRRVVFAPPNQSNLNRENRNYSFNDMQTRNIDQENERLLQEIIRKRLPRKKREQASQPIRRLPNSAVNRLKDQRRIERENFAFLQRLQSIKPTRGLTKYEQLNEYRRQMQYGVPTGTKSWRPKTPQSPSSYRSNIRSMSSMSSVHSLASSAASVGSASSRSRPQSAKKANNKDTRPAWEERW